MNRMPLAIILACLPLYAQTGPAITGPNPQVSCETAGNCLMNSTASYNIGTVRVGVGTTPPGSVPNSALGDFWADTAHNTGYICQNASGGCNGVAPGQWEPLANGANIPCVSVTTFGVNGTVATDGAKLQNGINTTAALHGCLFVPGGLTVVLGVSGTPQTTAISIPSNTTFRGYPGSFIQTFGMAALGVGVFDVPSSSSGYELSGLYIDGGVTVPVGVLYSVASANHPEWSGFTSGSTIWVHGPSIGGNIHDNTITHTGGYAGYFDATTGPIQSITLRNNTLVNNRPNLFGGTSGSEFYGSWTGGILFKALGSGGSNFQHIIVDQNTCQNVTGNCFWTQSSASSLRNSDVKFTKNTCINTLLDCTQINVTEGFLVTDNLSIRNGYSVTTDGGTPVPMWDQNGACPSTFDGAIGVSTGTIANNVASTFNGCFMDVDGGQSFVVANNRGTSCFASDDPLANTSLCGPYTSGSPVSPGANNYTKGITANNSASIPQGDTFLTIDGNSMEGLGTACIGAFGLQYGHISNNTCNLGSSTYQNPIVLGNIPGQHATGNIVTKNTCYWLPSSGAACVFEDANTFSTPFIATDQNYVNSNILVPGCASGCAVATNLYEFQKCNGAGGCGSANASSSGTGPVDLSSVTAGADSITATRIQTEGPSGNPTLAVYANNGAGTNIARLNAGGLLVGPVAFISLPAAVSFPNFQIACNNCTPGSNPCTGGGSGALAYSNGGTWNCLGGGSGGGVTGSGTPDYIAFWNGSTSLNTQGIYESAGVLNTPSGISSASGINAPGFNVGSFTGASVQIQIGCVISGGNCTSVYFAVPGGGSLACPAGGPSNCTYYTSFTTHGGVVTGLP